MMKWLLAVSLPMLAALSLAQGVRETYETNPFVIRLNLPAPVDSSGGLIVADLTGDGLMDYLVTQPKHVGAYANDGSELWVIQTHVIIGGASEASGLPGHHGPGVQAGDIDGDGHTEVLFLTRGGALQVVDGRSGKRKWSASPPVPDGAEKWEHVVIANFRGDGDRDVLLQATNKDGYRMGRYVAAFALEELASGQTTPLWQRNDFVSCAHNGARLGDLDGDGRDEVLGATVLSPDGDVLLSLPVKGHLDSIFIHDVRPDLPGLEVIALEEGGNRIFLFNARELLFVTDYKRQEPQNAAVGEFDTDSPGLEIWCRSRYDKHQRPFVFDSRGKLLSHYEMDAMAPEGWTVKGVEVIAPIHWTGESRQLAAAKERHESGDVCIFDPITGEFVRRFPEAADRLYVADVTGDWREELVVWSGQELHVYHNPAANPQPERHRLWDDRQYRRNKMTWNYYSP